MSAPSISLPKGGGAIRGIGEKFAANPVTGLGSTAVPIAVSPGLSEFGPQLSLSYDSGRGNGALGIGWYFHVFRSAARLINDYPVTWMRYPMCSSSQVQKVLPGYSPKRDDHFKSDMVQIRTVKHCLDSAAAEVDGLGCHVDTCQGVNTTDVASFCVAARCRTLNRRTQNSIAPRDELGRNT